MKTRGWKIGMAAAMLAGLLLGAAGFTGRAEAALLVSYTPAVDGGNTTANSSKWQLGGIFSLWPNHETYRQLAFIGSPNYSPSAGVINPDSPMTSGNLTGFLLTDNPSGTYSAATPQRMATLTSFTITGTFTPTSRQGLKQITLYYGNNQSQTITLPATPGSQTYTFAEPITTSYLYWTSASGDPDARYIGVSGFGNDQNVPYYGVSFDGTWGPTLTNVNAGATISTVGGVYGTDPNLINGKVYTDGYSAGRLFALNAGSDTITATYGSPKKIGSIGLGLSLDGNSPIQPARVTLNYTGGSEVINLRGDNLQYGVYNLAAPITTSFLTITFPDGGSPDGWFYSGGSQQYYGVTEFQAFEPPPSSPSGTLIKMR